MIRRSFIVIFLGCLCGLEAVWSASVWANSLNLEIGIVQRLGAKSIDEKDEIIDELIIRSTAEDQLTINFLDRQQIIKTKQAVVKVESQSLAKPEISEQLVLSSHATFETAEADAQFWQTLGIKVEILQPGRWQVWADRKVYPTPLVRRLLLKSLQVNGYQTPYLKTEVLSQVPQITVLIDGKKYHHNQVEITTEKNLVQVSKTNPKSSSTYLYGGNLRIQPNAYGNFTLVNQVPLETYLRGVVPYEIGTNAPVQAIAAQTILARTYALRNLRRFAADNYQLCATVHCQVYKGLTGVTPQTDNAIAKTKGLVLTYQNELVDALYSSTNGGVTASFSDIWNGSQRPYLKSVIDSPTTVWDLARYSLADEAVFRKFMSLKQGFNETGRGIFRWRKESKLEDLNRDLRKYLHKNNHPFANFKTIKSMAITERSQSGRILTLTVQTDQGIVELHKNEARSAFEPPRSTLFYLEPIYNQSQQLQGYAFVGGGFGHGVGLSQYGSYNLAQLGWSAEQILAFYFPGTTIEPLNNSIIFWRPPTLQKQ
ncbi:SpoIID/LytB domain protein [Stanieria sp. NIES-3757]|nr:SpoIID/LytB domain protein [Stanieria sp. NIES-3757]